MEVHYITLVNDAANGDNSGTVEPLDPALLHGLLGYGCTTRGSYSPHYGRPKSHIRSERKVRAETGSFLGYQDVLIWERVPEKAKKLFMAMPPVDYPRLRVVPIRTPAS